MRWFEFWRRRRAPAPAIELTLYTRVHCHLCDEMKSEIARAGTAEPYTLTEIDVDTDPALVERHGRSVPVLVIDGHVAFKGRLTAAEFRRKLERRVRERRAR